MSDLEANTTLGNTSPMLKIVPPILVAIPNNKPSFLDPRLAWVKTSEHPFAKAIRVTAAKVGDILNFEAKSCIKTTKYFSAISATHKNNIGMTQMIKMNMRTEFFEALLK